MLPRIAQFATLVSSNLKMVAMRYAQMDSGVIDKTTSVNVRKIIQ
jgi:hypothetical protein